MVMSQPSSYNKHPLALGQVEPDEDVDDDSLCSIVPITSMFI